MVLEKYFFSGSVWEAFFHRGHDWEAGRSKDGRVFHFGPFELIISRKPLAVTRRKRNAVQPVRQ